jgi:hypothetical protein
VRKRSQSGAAFCFCASTAVKELFWQFTRGIPLAGEVCELEVFRTLSTKVVLIIVIGFLDTGTFLLEFAKQFSRFEAHLLASDFGTFVGPALAADGAVLPVLEDFDTAVAVFTFGVFSANESHCAFLGLNVGEILGVDVGALHNHVFIV